MVDIRQSKEYANYMRSLGWIVVRIDNINYFIRKIPLLGSILKIQRPKEIRFDVIDRLCHKYGVFQTIIEPSLTRIGSHELMRSQGYKLAKSTYLPSKTLQIDLTASKEEILKHFKKDARCAIRKGGGLNIKEYSTPNKIIKFREAWKNSVKFDRYVPSAKQLIKLKESYPQNKSLFLTSHNISGSIIGGALFTTSSHGNLKDITYYWQAFTNKEGRALLSQYSLLYQGILWAKKSGYRIFDFEGVYDPRFPNKSWLGFTHFKRSFGGDEVSYPGCYIKFRLPFRFTKQ